MAKRNLRPDQTNITRRLWRGPQSFVRAERERCRAQGRGLGTRFIADEQDCLHLHLPTRQSGAVPYALQLQPPRVNQGRSRHRSTDGGSKGMHSAPRGEGRARKLIPRIYLPLETAGNV